MMPPAPSRLGKFVLAHDPGAHSGFVLIRVDPEEGPVARMPRCSVRWLGATIEQVQELFLVGPVAPRDLIVLIEDQYKGKASNDSRTTLSQRAGFFAGYAHACGVPLEQILFVPPQAWYRAIGSGAGLVKEACLTRIEMNLPPDALAKLDALSGAGAPHAVCRPDILAAIGIAWSYPFLPAGVIEKGCKLLTRQRKSTQKAANVARLRKKS